MYLIQYFVWASCLAMSLGSLGVHKTGWLDRVVQFYKKSFYDDVKTLAPVQIDATIQKAPPGYADSPEWTFETVTHLLVLISQSETSKPVFHALRRMLAPSRRIMMSKHDSYKNFPSLSKYIVNDIYYDTDYEAHTERRPFVAEQADYADAVLPEEQAIIVVSNPVEARLPSAQISVNLLKDILEARAMAGRMMPSTTRSTYHWVTTTNATNTTENANERVSDTASETAGDDSTPKPPEAASVASDGTPPTGGDAADPSPTEPTA